MGDELFRDIMDVTVEMRRCCSVIGEATLSGTLDSASSRRALMELLQLAQRGPSHKGGSRFDNPVRHSGASGPGLVPVVTVCVTHVYMHAAAAPYAPYAVVALNSRTFHLSRS